MSKTITIENEKLESDLSDMINDFLLGFEVTNEDKDKIQDFVCENKYKINKG